MVKTVFHVHVNVLNWEEEIFSVVQRFSTCKTVNKKTRDEYVSYSGIFTSKISIGVVELKPPIIIHRHSFLLPFEYLITNSNYVDLCSAF